MLSALPCHVLAAGGHILVPLVFHKTKGNAVETHWLPSSAGDFALNLQRRLWTEDFVFALSCPTWVAPSTEGFFSVLLPQCSENSKLLLSKSLSFKSLT